MAEVLENFQNACDKLDSEMKAAHENLKKMRIDISNMLSKDVKNSYNQALSCWQKVLLTEKNVSNSTTVICKKLLDFQQFSSKEITKLIQSGNKLKSDQILKITKKLLVDTKNIQQYLDNSIKEADNSAFAHYEFRKALNELEMTYNSNRSYSDDKPSLISSSAKISTNLSLKATKGMLELVSGGANAISKISGPSSGLQPILGVTSTASKLGAVSIDALEFTSDSLLASMSSLKQTLNSKKKEEIALGDLKKRMQNEALYGLWNSVRSEFENLVVTISEINKEIENNGNEKDSFKDSLENLEKLVISKEKMEWFKYLNGFFVKFNKNIAIWSKSAPKPLQL